MTSNPRVALLRAGLGAEDFRVVDSVATALIECAHSLTPAERRQVDEDIHNAIANSTMPGELAHAERWRQVQEAMRRA